MCQLKRCKFPSSSVLRTLPAAAHANLRRQGAIVTHHFGRLIDHVHLRVSDVELSKAFYRAVFTALGLPDVIVEGDGYFHADELWVDKADGAISRVHLAFQASDQTRVKAFHQAALAAGGRDNGAPGSRAYHPDYFAAFVLDPDGNNIEAVFHGPIERSAPSVTFTPASTYK